MRINPIYYYNSRTRIIIISNTREKGALRSKNLIIVTQRHISNIPNILYFCIIYLCSSSRITYSLMRQFHHRLPIGVLTVLKSRGGCSFTRAVIGKNSNIVAITINCITAKSWITWLTAALFTRFTGQRTIGFYFQTIVQSLLYLPKHQQKPKFRAPRSFVVSHSSPTKRTSLRTRSANTLLRDAKVEGHRSLFLFEHNSEPIWYRQYGIRLI